MDGYCLLDDIEKYQNLFGPEEEEFRTIYKKGICSKCARNWACINYE